MIYDFDPRSNREGVYSKSYSRRLLEDILTSKIVSSMSNGTASNYFTRSYGPNHRIIYEGVARLLSSVLVDTLDNIDDIEFSQLRAEFISTRLMYLVFPDEDSVPLGDTHEETIFFLLKTYEALLKGATKNSIDKALLDISEGNAVLVSDVEGYISDIRTSILATTEFNSDGYFTKHRHFAFTDESGLGSTNKPLEFKWGDNLHTHEIIDGVIQPYVDENGNSHTHDVYLGIPENIVRLQTNLRKVFSVIKPAHIKTGTISSVVDEDIPILAQNKQDVFSPILGLDSSKSDEQILVENTIDTTLPYYNQNAQYGLVGLSLGNLYQEEMRKARDGVYEPNVYGYVSQNKIRFWRTNIKVADNLVIGNQKLRVISVSDRIVPEDGTYTDLSNSFITKNVRPLVRGDSHDGYLVNTFPVEVKNAIVSRIELFGQDPNYFNQSDLFDDGEPISLSGEIYFCDIMGEEVIYNTTDGSEETNDYGHLVKLSYIEVTVDAQISLSGLQIVKNASSTWQVRDQNLYETVEFIKQDYPEGPASFIGGIYIPIPLYIVKDMAKTINGLPLSIFDLEIEVNGTPIDYSIRSLKFTSLIEQTLYSNAIRNQIDYSRIIVDLSGSQVPLANPGETITLTYPKAKSEIRRFRELNSLEMTLNATRPRRKVSDSGGGIGQNRVIETTSPISYVLNEPQPITPYTQEQKTATYSAGSSDLLNTSNQVLYNTDNPSSPTLFNSTYTLNNYSLNQTATQEQVFKPATKTITTSNPTISFYELSFRPQYITSVKDSDGVSYSYDLNKGHLFVHNLTEEKTLTVSGLSSNPFSADLDWYKGDRLNEGQAFYKHTSTNELSSFVESTSEEYMTNPLGLVPSQIRSIYSMNDIQTSGIEGELTFYEDVITEYELDGVDGFTNEYNPHNPQDDWLYPDPSLYVLGPNFIPTHLFFGYDGLTTSGGDGFYFSLYRLDAQNIKHYQTLSLRSDSNGFTALEQYPDPVPNGSPLAYRFRDDSLGTPTIDYDNGPAPTFLAEINAFFNHTPNETYYLEVFMEEDNDLDYLYFLSSGTDANFSLGSDWTTSPHAHRLDRDRPNGAVNNVTLTYEITFTLNPGEVKTIASVSDPNPYAMSYIEDNSQALDSRAIDNYAQPVLDRKTSWQDVITNWKDAVNTPSFFISSVADNVPTLSDSIIAPAMTLVPVNVDSTITFGDDLTTSLLLFPATITESVGSITDTLSVSFNYTRIYLDDLVSFSGVFDSQLNLVSVSLSDNVDSITDDLIVPVYQRLVPSSSIPSVSDDSLVRISSFNVSDTVSSLSDTLLVSYALLPLGVSDNVPSITDSESALVNFTPALLSDTLPSLSDESKAFISSYFVGSSVSLNDGVSTSLSLSPISLGDTVDVSDSITVPIYQTLVPSSTVGTITDSLNTQILIYKDIGDTIPLTTDSLSVFLDYSDVLLLDTVPSITDIEATSYSYTPVSLGDSLTFNAFTEAFISATFQTDPTSIGVTDGATTTINIVVPSLLIALKYDSYADSDNELFSLYKGSMDTLEYPAIVDLQPDSNSTTAVGIHNGTPSSAPAITNERYVYALGPSSYTNSNNDANVRIGPLEFDTTYTMYSYTEYPGDAVNINVAMKTGISASDPDGFLSGVSYTDIMPVATGSTDKYYLHELYIRSSDNAVIFTADSPRSFPFGDVDTTPIVRLYIHFKYTYTQGTTDGADFFAIRPALSGWTHLSPNGSPADYTGWIQPDLHATITGFSNAIDGSGTYNYTTLPDFSVSNTNNDAQLSLLLEVGVRYQFRCLIDDQDPDFQIYLEPRTNDNGASWNTVYNSSSVLTYTETVQRDDDGRRDIYHFFTIRRDGFIIWEQDPDSVS